MQIVKVYNLFLVCIISFLIQPFLGFAEEQEELSPQAQRYKTAVENMWKAAIEGPTDIQLIKQGILHLPKEYLFIPKAEATEWMEARGDKPNNGFIGLVLSSNDNDVWFIEINYQDSGYIKDDDAKNWDINKLFQSFKEGTEEHNKLIKEQGFEEIEVVRWDEKPQYDTSTHKLIWSMVGRSKGEINEENYGINYNSYALGREGYFVVNLVTSYNSIEQDKLHAKTILNSIEYNKGKRYEDFLEGSDKVATYGLAALIGGAVAKKAGLLSIIGIFLLKIWKIVAVAVAVFFSKIVKFFKKDKDL